MFQKRAKRISKEYQGAESLPEEHVLVRKSGEEYRDIIMRSCELDYVFHDQDPMEKSAVSVPSYRGGEIQRESTNVSRAVTGSGHVQSGPESVRPVDDKNLQSRNTSGRSRVVTVVGSNLVSNDGVPGVRGAGSVQSEPVYPSLNTPRILQSGVTPSMRVLSLDTSESIDEIVSRLSVEGCKSNDQIEQWSKLMKHRQNLVEEKVNKMYEGMNKFFIALYGTEAMFQDLEKDIDILKPKSSELWERLKIDEQRLSKLESNVDKLDSKLDEKVEIMVNTETMVDAELMADTKIVQINNMIMADAGLIADADVGMMADAELMIDTKLEQIENWSR